MSRRTELSEYLESGHLRDALERAAPRLSPDAVDLVVDVCSRYCEPRRSRRRGTVIMEYRRRDAS